MAKRRAARSAASKDWNLSEHKIMLGVWMFFLGVILYLVEMGAIPWNGSIWSMALILTGLLLAFKKWLLPFR